MMGGGGGGGKGTEMVFVNIRDGVEMPAGGIDQMAKDFAGLLQTGGVTIPIVGVEDNQMIALCDNLMQVVELRRILLNMEEIQSLTHDKETYYGTKLSAKERKRLEKKANK